MNMQYATTIPFSTTTAPSAGKCIRVQQASRAGAQVVEIEPGTRARDLLAFLGLDSNGYEVSSNSGMRVFGADENLYGLIKDGDALLVASKIDAGR